MRMVVVLPAPFGPRKPTICPFGTSNEMWSTAMVRAYRLLRSFTLIIKIILIGETHSHGTDPQPAERHDSYVKNSSQYLSKPELLKRPEKLQLSL
jgi:hypothetical protein